MSKTPIAAVDAAPPASPAADAPAPEAPAPVVPDPAPAAPVAAKRVKAVPCRVLTACRYGAPDDLAQVPADELAAAKDAGQVDDDKGAVAYARSLQAAD